MQIIRNREIRLSEIFTSIEGEGYLFGTKTLFIRIAGCHLNVDGVTHSMLYL